MGLFKSIGNVFLNHTGAPDQDSRELKKEDFVVVGTNYYMDNIKKLACCNPEWKSTNATIVKNDHAGKKVYRYNYVNKPLKLAEEPKNKHDKNAIQVVVAGELVGYISADENVYVKEILRKKDIKYMSCFVSGGQWKIVDQNKESVKGEDNIRIKIIIAYS